MNLIRKSVSTVGAIILGALVLAGIAPRAARGVAAALVQITNTSANPVPTVDNNAAFPWSITVGVDNTNFFTADFIAPTTTPTGVPVQRAVVETTGVRCTAPVGTPNLVASISANVFGSGNSSQSYSLPVIASAPGFYLSSPSAVRIYIPPGGTNSFGVNGTGDDTVCFLTLSGRLETQ